MTEPARRSWVDQVMGMPISILVRGPAAREPATELAAQRVFAELREVDALFSTYRADSQISRLDRGELDTDGCDPLVREVLELSATACRLTDGLFDVRRPDATGRLRLDPSGLVKGWAAERAARHLAAVEGHDWILNAGGDVVLRSTVGPAWRVGVEDPHDRSRVLAAVPMQAGGMATSGTAARGDHVVDPKTGKPARGLASITVVGPSLLWADVYATAALVQGPAALFWLAGLAHHHALLVLPNGTQRATSGWAGLLAGQPVTSQPDHRQLAGPSYRNASESHQRHCSGASTGGT